MQPRARCSSNDISIGGNNTVVVSWLDEVSLLIPVVVVAVAATAADDDDDEIRDRVSLWISELFNFILFELNVSEERELEDFVIQKNFNSNSISYISLQREKKRAIYFFLNFRIYNMNDSVAGILKNK